MARNSDTWRSIVPTVETVQAPPNPVRMIEGLRDTGYKFHTAIADLVDNSIAANATIADVKVSMDYKGAITVWIVDNGCGMTKDGLISGMTYGSLFVLTRRV